MDDTYCDKYYVCSDGKYVGLFCPVGMAFDYGLQECHLKQRVDCSKRPLFCKYIYLYVSSMYQTLGGLKLKDVSVMLTRNEKGFSCFLLDEVVVDSDWFLQARLTWPPNWQGNIISSQRRGLKFCSNNGLNFFPENVQKTSLCLKRRRVFRLVKNSHSQCVYTSANLWNQKVDDFIFLCKSVTAFCRERKQLLRQRKLRHKLLVEWRHHQSQLLPQHRIHCQDKWPDLWWCCHLELQ